MLNSRSSAVLLDDLPIERSVSSAVNESRSTKTGISMIGNREDLAEYYHRAKQAVFALKVYQFLQVQEPGEGDVTITICNLWKLEKRQGQYHFYTYYLNKKMWIKSTDEDLTEFPIVPFFPFNTSLQFGERILRSAIYKTVLSAGFYDLPKNFTMLEHQNHDPDVKLMRRAKILHIVVSYFLGYSGSDDESRQAAHNRKSFIRQDILNCQIKKYRKLFYQYFYDAEIVKLIRAFDYQYFHYTLYLQALMHRDDVMRTATERRNCIPILFFINSKYWHKENLFSRKLWVRGDKKFKLVDRQCFMSDRKRVGFQSFIFKSGWAWITRQSISIVNAWVKNGRSSMLVTILSRIHHPDIKAPASAYRHIMYQWRDFMCTWDTVKLQWFYSAFLIHITQLWQSQGYASVRVWLKHESNLMHILDWLRAEGFAQGFPDKKSSWQSLSTRSDQWHANLDRRQSLNQKLYQATWSCILPELDIDGIQFVPLNSAQDLIREGDDMHHCIGSDDYIDRCRYDIYRAFHLSNSLGQSATLGIYLDNNRLWKLDQLSGPHNHPPDNSFSGPVRKFVKHYNHALQSMG